MTSTPSSTWRSKPIRPRPDAQLHRSASPSRLDSTRHGSWRNRRGGRPRSGAGPGCCCLPPRSATTGTGGGCRRRGAPPEKGFPGRALRPLGGGHTPPPRRPACGSPCSPHGPGDRPRRDAHAVLGLVFRAGLGGRLGSGRQYWPWISLRDEIDAIRFLLTADVSGPVNLTAPSPVTNAEFTRKLGRAVHRPTVLASAWLAISAVLASSAGPAFWRAAALLREADRSPGSPSPTPRLDEALRSGARPALDRRPSVAAAPRCRSASRPASRSSTLRTACRARPGTPAPARPSVATT